MIKQVASFQTTDGTLFTDKIQALQHEGKIGAQALVNSKAIGKLPTINSRDVAQFLVTNADEVIETLRKYKEGIRRAQAGKQAAQTRAAS